MKIDLGLAEEMRRYIPCRSSESIEIKRLFRER